MTNSAAAISLTALACTFVCVLHVPKELRAQQRPETASILGRVVTAVGPPQPIANAEVSLTAGDGSAPVLTTTDTDGMFAFEGLAAGRYILQARGVGYLAQFYGAPRPSSPSATPIVLAPGTRQSLSVTLTREAVISGSVELTSGVPVGALRVHVLRVGAGGEYTVVPGGARSVDNQGKFRLAGLAPGQHRVLITAAGDLSRFERDGKQVTFAPAYYPVSADTPLTLEPGAAVDIRMPITLVEVAQMAGQSVGPNGDPPTAIQGWLLDPNSPVPRLSLQVRGGNQGRFEILGAPVGNYLFIARGANSTGELGGATLWAREPISLTTNGTNLMIPLKPARAVAGRVRTDDAKSPVPKTVRLSLTPSGRLQMGTSIQRVESKPDGSFVFPNVPPGDYRLEVIPGEGGGQLGLKSAVSGQGRDFADEVVVVGLDVDVTDVDIVLSAALPQWRGKITDSTGQPVTQLMLVVFPVNPSQRRAGSRRVVAVRPGTDGSFFVGNIPAGEYFACAVTDAAPNQLADSAFLEMLAASAAKIVLAEGERKILNLVAGSSK